MAGVAFLGFGGHSSPAGALFLQCPGVWNVRDCGSGASGFGFTSFGAFWQCWAGGSLTYGRGGGGSISVSVLFAYFF